MIGSTLLRYNKRQKYLFFDKETEGLNKLFSRPFQVSYMVCDLDKIYETHNDYIWWPDLKMSKGAAAITRFNYNIYKELAKDARIVFNNFNKYLYDDNLIKIGHNILNYDSEIYNNWRRIMGCASDYSFQQNMLDTDLLARAIEKNIAPDKENLLQWQFKMSTIIEKGLKTNLASQGKKYKIDYDYDNLHDGFNDIILNRLVFLNQIWHIEI